MAAAWSSAASPSQTWEGATTRGVDGLCSLIRTFRQTRPGGVGTMGMILARIARGLCGVVVSRGPTLSSDAIEHLEDLTEALEIEEVIGPSWQLILRRGEIIGVAEGDGGMPPVGESDDELRNRSTPKADDLDLLAVERMMGMGDGDQSRRRLGRRGSALGASPPSAPAWCRWRRSWSWSRSLTRTCPQNNTPTEPTTAPTRRCGRSKAGSIAAIPRSSTRT